ncbi:MAG: hypothetical protein ACRD0N_11270 [Acidimicrobiales bacterium]
MTGGRFVKCPCGSGRRANRCCSAGQHRLATEAARAHLDSLVVPAVCMVVSCSREELVELYDRALRLPDLDPSLRLALPERHGPVLAPLLRAVAAGHAREAEEAAPAVLARVDTPIARARLAKAVIALRDAGCIDPRVAAVALLELSTPKLSRLVSASVIRAAADAAGTPPLRVAG